jgi:hypothetical protein
LMGVTRMMRCANGNSANINGRLHLTGHSLSDMHLLNSEDWREVMQ